MVTLQAAFVAMALTGAGQTVLLDFYTDGCGPCRAIAPTIQALEKAGYPVQRINGGREPARAAKHGVTGYPTFVMLVDGNEVGRVVGSNTTYSRLEQLCKLGVSVGPTAKAPAMLAQNGPLSSQPVPPSSLAMTSPFDERGSRPAAAQPISPPARATGGAADSAMLAASVRLRVEDPGGRSCGSGTIIDAGNGEALVLTCGHIFRDSQGKGPITVDLFGPDGIRPVAGHLISYDINRDVGLVSIRTPGPVAAARVAPPGYHVNRGMPVVSIGCNNGESPTARHSQVTSLDKFMGPPNIQVAGQPVEGRSGGGLFSAEGYVIGVCNAADPSDQEGLFAAPGSIYAELDRKNSQGKDLSFVYKSPNGISAGPAESAAPMALAANNLPAMPTQRPGTLELAALGPVPPPAAAAPSGLPPHEQAALDEIHRRVKEGAEVVCIVRPHDNPNAKSEVFTVDHASPEFLKRVAADARPADRPYPTSLELRTPELPQPRKKVLEWSAVDTLRR